MNHDGDSQHKLPDTVLTCPCNQSNGCYKNLFML